MLFSSLDLAVAAPSGLGGRLIFLRLTLQSDNFFLIIVVEITSCLLTTWSFVINRYEEFDLIYLLTITVPIVLPPGGGDKAVDVGFIWVARLGMGVVPPCWYGAGACAIPPVGCPAACSCSCPCCVSMGDWSAWCIADNREDCPEVAITGKAEVLVALPLSG
jgi:hypothetical protein